MAGHGTAAAGAGATASAGPRPLSARIEASLAGLSGGGGGSDSAAASAAAAAAGVEARRGTNKQAAVRAELATLAALNLELTGQFAALNAAVRAVTKSRDELKERLARISARGA